MWIAPSGSAAQGHWEVQSARAPQKKRRGAIVVLVALGALAVLMVVGTLVGFVLFRGGAQPARPVGIASDVPLQLGDGVIYYYDKNSSCSSYVEAFESDGRVRVSSCASGAASAPRNLLQLDDYRFMAPESGDVVLHHGKDGWQRLLVIGLDSGQRLRAEPLAGGTATTLPKDEVRIARRSGITNQWVTPPRTAPLETGDVVEFRFGNELRSGAVQKSGGDLTVLPGHMGNAGFSEDGDKPVKVERSRVLLPQGSSGRTPADGTVLLTEHGGKWTRASFDSEGEWCRWTVKSGGDSWVEWCGDVLLLPQAPAAAPADSASAG